MVTKRFGKGGKDVLEKTNGGDAPVTIEADTGKETSASDEMGL